MGHRPPYLAARVGGGITKDSTMSIIEDIIKNTVPTTHPHLTSFIGASVPEAERAAAEAGMPCRVVNVDGRPRVIVWDHVPRRINLWVRDHKVVSAFYG